MAAVNVELDLDVTFDVRNMLTYLGSGLTLFTAILAVTILPGITRNIN